MRTAYDSCWSTLPRPKPKIAKEEGGGSFWRKELPTMDGRKVVRGGMFTHQREFWELETFIKLIVAGYGAGKTIILCKRLIALALHNAPVPCAIVSPSYPAAKLTTIPTCEALLAGKQSIEGRNFAYRFVGQAPMFFEIAHRGRIATLFILSGERPYALKGGNLASVGIDEPFIQDLEVFEQMVARVRHPDAKRIEIAMSGTPESLNWGYDLCEGELSEQYDVGVVHAATGQNLALPVEYESRLRQGYDDQAVQAFVEGRFVNMAKGRVYYGFATDDNVVKRDMPAGATLGIGMDFNVNPMAFVLFWRTEKHMHVIKEYELANADTDYACYVLREHPLVAQHQIEVFPDPAGVSRHTNAPAGQSDFSILRRHGFRLFAKSVHPAIRDRENAVNGKLKSSEGIVSLTVDPSCKKLISYMNKYTHELKNKQKEMSHLLDALGYAVDYLWPVVRPSGRAVRYTAAA